jgi:hypothetical protein
MPLAPVPPKPVRPAPKVGSLTFFLLPKGGAIGGAFLEGGALEAALRFGGAFDLDFDLPAILFFLSVTALGFFSDVMQIAGRNTFGDLASCRFRRTATFLQPARSAEELLLGWGDLMAFNCPFCFSGHAVCFFRSDRSYTVSMDLLMCFPMYTGDLGDSEFYSSDVRQSNLV